MGTHFGSLPPRIKSVRRRIYQSDSGGKYQQRNIPKNRKYLDNIAYQEYLRKIQKESSDYNDQ